MLTEIGFRLYNKINPLFIFYDNSYNRFRGKPFAYDYDFRLNSRGFKDVEFSKEKKNVFRILGIGDSFTYGVVPYQYNYLTILEDELNHGHRAFEVINMGIPRTGPKDYLSILISEGLELEPDMVLISFFIGNDFIDEREKRKIYSYSYVVSFLRYVFHILPQYKGRVIHGRMVYQDDKPNFTYDRYLIIEKRKDYIFRKDNNQFLTKFAKAVRYLEEIKSICEKEGIEMIVIIIPDEIQVNRVLQSDVINFLKAGPEDFDFSLPNKMLSNTLENLKINYVDLYEYFVESSKKKRLYKPNDTHWNIAGNRLAAEILRDYIKEMFNNN